MCRHRIHAPEQGGNARQQMRQAHVFGEVIVGAHAQARDRVEIAIARGEKNNRQGFRLGAQIAAQRKAAVDFVG